MTDAPAAIRVACIVVGAFFMASVIYMYAQLVIQHKSRMTNPDVEILNLRMAGLLPLYGVMYFIGIFVPSDWEFLEFGVSFVEGYCIYCFFVMIAHEIGSLDEVKRCIMDADVAAPCFYGCQKNTPLGCFMTMRILLMQFFLLRPLLFLIIAILEELQILHHLVVFLGVMVLVSIIVAMITLIRSYNIFNKSMGHLRLAKKILFIKFVIFIVLIGNNVVHKYQNSGYFASGEPRAQPEFDKARQIYCLFSLFIFFVAAFFYKPVFEIDMEADPVYGGKRGIIHFREIPMGTFLCHLCSPWTLVFTPIGMTVYNIELNLSEHPRINPLLGSPKKVADINSHL